MPRLKGSTEGPQKPSPTARVGRHIRTSSSDSDPLHRRPVTERSPRVVGAHQSPRSTQSDPLKPKKLGTRITDLETQLVQAQRELKSLKTQLSSAEAAKKQAQEQLNKKGAKKQHTSTRKVVGPRKPDTATTTTDTATATVVRKNISSRDKPGDDDYVEEVDQETDVFEVPVEKMLVEPDPEPELRPEPKPEVEVEVEVELSSKLVDSCISKQEKQSLCDEVDSMNDSRNEEMDRMKALMEDKERELQRVVEENMMLKKQLEEASSEIESRCKRGEEMGLKVKQLEQDLAVNRVKEDQLKENLVEAEAAKEMLEIEMKKMKVQTEQWRKAADAAASVLAGGLDTKGRISERCVSMDNHFNSVFEDPPMTGFGGYFGSPGAGDDPDDGFGGGKKKGSGIRMLGDLWKKKGHK